MVPRIPIDHEKLIDFCRRWPIAELALFGSVLRDDFDPARSDVDVVVELRPESEIGLIEFIGMAHELEAIFGRRVDLVSKNGIKPRLRQEILGSSQVVYRAAA